MGLSDFQIISKLGEGSYSSVWRVKRNSDGQDYAMKKVKLTSLSDKEKQNSINEVRILASIKDPNIIGYKEAFIDEASGILCIIMEYAAGGDLSGKILEHQKAKTFFKEAEIWNFIVQMIMGLKKLHEMKILHRDLKSANVFLSKDGTEVKLGDLNVSKVLKSDLVYTQTGTPYYASPEIWKDQPYDMKSDIWSLGCVFYEMASLKPPFRAKDMEGLYRRVQKGVFDRIPSQYSNDLFNFISLCLKVSPVLRPTCDQLLKHSIVQRNCQDLLNTIEEGSTINALLSTIRFPKNLRALGQVLPKPNYGNERVEDEIPIKKLPRILQAEPNMYLSKGYGGVSRTNATENDKSSIRHDLSAESRVTNVVRSEVKPRKRIERESLASKASVEAYEHQKGIKASDINTPKETIILAEHVNCIKPSPYKPNLGRKMTKDPQIRLELQRMDRLDDYENKMRRYSSNNTTCGRSNSIAPALSYEKSCENLLASEIISSAMLDTEKMLDGRDITPSKFLSKQSDVVISYRNRSQLLLDEKYNGKRLLERVNDDNTSNSSKVRVITGRHGVSNRLYNNKSSLEGLVRRSGDPTYGDYNKDLLDLGHQSNIAEGKKGHSRLEEKERKSFAKKADHLHSHKYIAENMIYRENESYLKKRRNPCDDL